MKKSLLTALLAFTAISVSLADDVPLSSGYYRVKNYKTNRFIYVYDNTGTINAAAGSADVGALELWKNPDKPVSDPASILYANYIGDNGHGGYAYNVEGQGTSVYDIISYYVSVIRESGQLKIYASVGGFTKYLDDEESNPNRDKGAMGFNREGDYRKWIEIPLDANSDNYFGLAPVISANGKYYQPFYASFPFNFASAGMKAFYVKEYNQAENIAVIAEISGDVPGAMPVIVECSSDQPTDNRFNLLRNNATPLADNQLKGVYFNNERRPRSEDARTQNDPATMRVLTTDASGKLVFSTSDAEYMPANQSYLLVPAGSPEVVTIMTEEEYNARTVLISAITLSSTEATLTEGETMQLTATVTPANATNTDLVWYSSDESVATVSASGLVTAVASGTAVISAKANDGSGVESLCSITVEPKVYLVATITLSNTEATLLEGETLQLSATVSPDNATNPSLTWTSSNAEVATVDESGVVTAVAAGEAVITVKANDGSEVQATCQITVEKSVVLVNEILLNVTEQTLIVGNSLQLTATVAPADATDPTISWSTSDSQVAIVDTDGLVTALAPGEVVITATANDASGISASCTLTVENGEGISVITVDSKAEADLYTVTGIKVRKAGQMLNGLPAGLYILDGKKVILY